MKYIIGIDIGTTATKGVLYDLDGQTIMIVSQSYPLIQKELGQAEEDPQVIFSGRCDNCPLIIIIQFNNFIVAGKRPEE